MCWTQWFPHYLISIHYHWKGGGHDMSAVVCVCVDTRQCVCTCVCVCVWVCVCVCGSHLGHFIHRHEKAGYNDTHPSTWQRQIERGRVFNWASVTSTCDHLSSSWNTKGTRGNAVCMCVCVSISLSPFGQKKMEEAVKKLLPQNSTEFPRRKEKRKIYRQTCWRAVWFLWWYPLFVCVCSHACIICVCMRESVRESRNTGDLANRMCHVCVKVCVQWVCVCVCASDESAGLPGQQTEQSP